MHYWQSLVDHVKNKPYTHAFLADEPFLAEPLSKAEKEMRDSCSYYLGEKYGNISLTRREEKCIFWLVQTHTISDAAAKMGLSPRTIEFYIKRLKSKFQCKSKKSLIKTVLQTTLLQQLEKQGLIITKH